MNPISKPVLSRIVLARYFHRLADDNAKIGRDVSDLAAIGLLQDALESFLVAAADHLNASVAKRAEFESYLDKINEKIEPKELPFRRRLIEINKVRVLAKHDGIKPNSSELIGYVTDSKFFLEEASRIVFGVEFWSVSLIDLVEEGEIKELLLTAQNYFDEKNFEECLVSCRKAFFIEVEKAYDIRQTEGFLAKLLGYNKAPAYARSKDYVERSVREPFDYIVLDHARVNAELLADGLDPSIFWNVWRLTPEVYRFDSDGPWQKKSEFHKLENAESNAAFVLEGSIDFFIAKALKKRARRYIQSSGYTIKVRSKNTNIYQKADSRSKVIAQLPDDLNEVSIEYATPGLVAGESFWKIDFEFNGEGVSGYVSHSEITFED